MTSSNRQMIKRTLYLGNPSSLTLAGGQLVISQPMEDDSTKMIRRGAIPVEDIGVVILDNPSIALSLESIQALLENNTALISCDVAHMPTGLMLNMFDPRHEQKHLVKQMSATEALKKRLWKQTVEQKIESQSAFMREVTGVESPEMRLWLSKLKGGDVEECESEAESCYLQFLDEHLEGGDLVNGNRASSVLLSYGYALLRALVARSLVGSGLHPMYGIRSDERFTHYCLAEDIMQPYLPFVDRIVHRVLANYPTSSELSADVKKELLAIPVEEVRMEDELVPLMVAIRRTASSLSNCLEGEQKRVAYPII